MASMFNTNRHKPSIASSNSIYSMVSCSDLTPGSLDVWVDLPDAIKFDPALAPFKRLYEQHYGKIQQQQAASEGDKTIFGGKKTSGSQLEPLGESKETSADSQDNDGTENKLADPLRDEDNNEIKLSEKKEKPLEKALRILKLSALVAGWVLLTVALLMNREKTDVVLHTAVKGNDVQEYQLPLLNQDTISIQVSLTGPFSQAPGNYSEEQHLLVWMSRTMDVQGVGEVEQNTTVWSIPLQPPELLDFSASVSDSQTLTLDSIRGSDGLLKDTNGSQILDGEDAMGEDNVTSLTLRMQCTGVSTVPLTVSYQLNPLLEADGILYSTILLLVLYVLIIFEVINRTIAALLTSSLSIAVLALSGQRPSLPELVSWLDVETLLLLFSMMLLVAILADTGLFDYLAVLAFEVTGGRTWPLINCLCFFTAVFSTVLDNVTTVLLMTPVTIRLCEVMQLNPVPVLMCMVIFSNVGGAATPVGDPPNVIIASHPAMIREDLNFTTFTVHMGVGILLVCVQTYFQLRFMFRDMGKLRHSEPSDVLEMRQEIAVWRRAAASLSAYSRDEDLVRKALEKKVSRLTSALRRREAGGGGGADPRFCATLAQMKEKYRIRDKTLLIKSCVCVSFVVVVFFLHAIPQLQGLSLGWTALLGALLLLLLADSRDLEPVLARVEWATLLFFAALFVLMEALSKLGLISWIGSLTTRLILQVGEESRLAVALMLVLWVSGIASAFVDNIPLTTMMVRVTSRLAERGALGLPLAPLTWALSFGACLGGNGTLIGASANVVCAGVAEQHGYRFTFLEYLKVGFPIMVGNLLVASVYLLVCHCLIGWH